MAKLIDLKIDVTKIDKSKLFQGKKGTYLDLTVAVNDEKDDYGNDVACWQAQTQKDREDKETKNYLGNGKIFWTNEQDQPKPTTQSDTNPSDNNDDGDDLPF